MGIRIGNERREGECVEERATGGARGGQKWREGPFRYFSVKDSDSEVPVVGFGRHTAGRKRVQLSLKFGPLPQVLETSQVREGAREHGWSEAEVGKKKLESTITRSRHRRIK